MDMILVCILLIIGITWVVIISCVEVKAAHDVKRLDGFEDEMTCPECYRHFENLERHMKNKHPQCHID